MKSLSLTEQIYADLVVQLSKNILAGAMKPELDPREYDTTRFESQFRVQCQRLKRLALLAGGRKR